MNFASQDARLRTNLLSFQQMLRNLLDISDSAVPLCMCEVSIEVNALPRKAKQHVRGGEVERLGNLSPI